MALDLEARRVVVTGLDPSETPMISPPNRSRWNESGDEVSTSKLGMMLSNMQVSRMNPSFGHEYPY